FADQTVEILPSPTNLTAQISENTFVVEGETANRFSQVRINNFDGQPQVTDNGNIPVIVPVSSDGSSITTVDMLGLTGVGV
ncbi:hypothetical protein, partial [Paracoccus sp. S4493]|uniref:hypothetical protein n=1 Tax=Paracoccus sp. S4493 TaxID=579490 RepID=UPI001951CB42